jgi:hypothetical protein
MKTAGLLPVALCLLLPLAAQAGDRDDGPGKEVRRDLVDARHEMQADLAKARAELETENLEVGNDFHFGKDGKHESRDKSLPKAEITPRGDFLVGGKAVAINAAQRSQLLGYRGQVIEIARTGIDLGERGAQVALETVDRPLLSLIVGGLTGSLERQVEATVKREIEPGVRQICSRLPALRVSQQQLAASLPQFRPYATLEADDVAECEADVRREFATR